MRALEAAPDTSRLTAAAALQRLLPQLVGLSLEANQAQWNVTGQRFLSLHRFSAELVASSREWADRVAARAVALGFAVDARAATVASAGSTFPAGVLSEDETIAELLVSIDRVVAAAHVSLDELADADPVTHRVAVDVIEELERYRWQLRAQTVNAR